MIVRSLLPPYAPSPIPVALIKLTIYLLLITRPVHPVSGSTPLPTAPSTASPAASGSEPPCDPSQEEAAWKWVWERDPHAVRVKHDENLAEFNYYMCISEDNYRHLKDMQRRSFNFREISRSNSSKFPWRNFCNSTLKRFMYFLNRLEEEDIKSTEIRNKLEKSLNEIGRIWKASYLFQNPYNNHTNDFQALTDLLEISNQSLELQWAWEALHNGRAALRPHYIESIKLKDQNAKENGYTDLGELWRSAYEMENLEAQLAAIYSEIEPLYRELHAFARHRLREKFPEVYFPKSGHIPAHLLGNTWAQHWHPLKTLLEPFPKSPAVDISEALRLQNYSAKSMALRANSFFVSLGLSPLTDKFWNRSVLEANNLHCKTDCQPFTQDLFLPGDYGLKACLKPKHKEFLTIHHELGHAQYIMQYSDQLVEFRSSPNLGFHEAIGDVMSLSVQTIDYLKQCKLLDPEFRLSNESQLNLLMQMALHDKIVFLPFGYLLDLWRWRLFDGSIPFERLNSEYWRYRYQGLSMPSERTELHFDAATKRHVTFNDQYIWYFISYILQFQIHKALCRVSNHSGPLYSCSIYGSKIAGQLLREAMVPGRSIKWSELLTKLTGEQMLNASALVEYFAPLYEWLRAENKRNGERSGWALDGCPPARPSPFFFPSPSTPVQKAPDESAEGTHRGVWLVVGALALVIALKVSIAAFVVLLRRRRRRARKLSRAPFKDKHRHASPGTDGPENSFLERDSPDDPACKTNTPTVAPLVQIESVL